MIYKLQIWWVGLWKDIEFGAIDGRSAFISTGDGYTEISSILLDDFKANVYLAKYRDWLTKSIAFKLDEEIIKTL